MAYTEPKGIILEASREGDTSRLCIRFDKTDIGPIAPAGLYTDPKSGHERFQLHKLLRKEGDRFFFETYDSAHPLPVQGEIYYYRGWWLPKAMEAALDISEQWVREKFPEKENHEHCLFTWEKIGAGSSNDEGYHSKYGWITVDAYKMYILDDIYRLRY